MSKLFSTLVQESLIDSWADILDWLLDDNRFPKDKWKFKGTDNLRKFTNRISKLEGLKPENNICDALKRLSFPNAEVPPRKPVEPTIMIGKDESKGKDIVRHIRNGIAHGHTELMKNHGELYIEILDYNNKKEQTAYLFIPVSYIERMCKIYHEIENSVVKRKRKK